MRIATERRWHEWLGLNSSTAAVLGTVLLLTAASELWAPLLPQYLKDLQQQATQNPLGWVWLIGLYGLYRDGLEAANYYAGGALAGWLNTRRALLLLNLVPLAGLGLLALWPSRTAVFAAIPLVLIWDSIASPATLRVVGDALPPDRRTMAFSLQAIGRRLARIAAYSLSAALVFAAGRGEGVRLGAWAAMGLVCVAALLQYRLLKSAQADAQFVLLRPRALLARFGPDLRRLLVSDILSRWAEGLAGPFIIIYCAQAIAGRHAESADALTLGVVLYQSVLLNIQAATNIASYVVIGPRASRAGLAKKPFIGATFVFFALFPLALAWLEPTLGFAGLCAAFVVGGLRELGEPARKAMITELVPDDVRSQAIGLYWAVRGAAVMLAAPVGAALWVAGESLRPGAGPVTLFTIAGLVGLVGAGIFYRRFGRAGADAAERTAK